MPGDVAVPWICKSAVPPLCWFMRVTTDSLNPVPSTSPVIITIPSPSSLVVTSITLLSVSASTLRSPSIVISLENDVAPVIVVNVPPLRTVISSPLNERPSIVL